jgi:ATP-dependent Clp protease adaptor protein ClpS
VAGAAALHHPGLIAILTRCSHYARRVIMPLERPDFAQEPTDGTDLAEPAKVILFNDDVHTFDEVITQLIKAVRCTRERAEAWALEVHTRGKACVYTGEMPECLRVSNILEEIGLHTQIEL